MLTAIFVMVIAILALQAVGVVIAGVTAYRSDQRMKRDQEEHERRTAETQASFDRAVAVFPQAPPLHVVPKDKDER